MAAYAQHFGGASYLISGSSNSWPVSQGTLAVWFYLNAQVNQYQYIFDRADFSGPTLRQIRLRKDITTDEIRALLAEDNSAWQHSVASTGAATPVTTWMFVVATFKVASSLKLYVGTEAGAPLVLYDSGTSILEVSDATLGTTFGAGNQGLELRIENGTIGQTVMWDRELTLDELNYAYNSGAGRNYNYYKDDVTGNNNPGTVDMSHYWKMDDLEPSSVNDTIRTGPWDFTRAGTVTRVAGHIDEDDAPPVQPAVAGAGYNAFVSTLLR